MKVVDHEQQRTARDEIGKSRVDGVEQSVSRAAVVSPAPRLKRTSDASLRQRLGVGLERCQWLFGAATHEHGGALLDGGGSELLRETRLADPGLTRDQRDPAIAVHLHAAPAGAQPRQFGAAADEHGFVRAGEAYRWWHGLRLLAAEFLDQGTCLARGRDAKLRAQALAELAAGGQRGGTVAGCGQPLDQPAVRRFRERVESDLGAGQPNRLRRIGRGGRSQLERAGELLRVLVAGLDRPLLLEVVQDRRVAGLECPRRIALGECLLELADIDSEVRTFQRDRVPRCHHVAGSRPERLAQLRQRDPQARARRLVKHVRPEPRRNAGPRLWAGVQCEKGQDRTRPPRRGQVDPRAIHAQLKTAG